MENESKCYAKFLEEKNANIEALKAKAAYYYNLNSTTPSSITQSSLQKSTNDLEIAENRNVLQSKTGQCARI